MQAQAQSPLQSQASQKKSNFIPYNGDLIGLVTNENYLVFKWNNDDCKILFSVSRRGNAANCHFASDKKGLRYIKQAIGEFCKFVFWLFDWCTMVMAIIHMPSVVRIVEKLGFNYLTIIEDKKVYIYGKHS